MNKLIIDSRENSQLYDYVELEAHRLMIVTEKQWLEIGDYVYGDVCFEAKSSSDFLQSVINKRIWNQLDNMDRHYEHTYVIIHGSFHDAMDFPKYSKLKISTEMLHNKFFGAIGKISLDTDCKVMWFENPKKAAQIITTICKMRPINRKVMNPALLKSITTGDLRLDLLCTIKGVSETKAKKLIRAYGSVMEIGETSAEELCNIDGIGLTTAQRIIDTLHSEDKVII